MSGERLAAVRRLHAPALVAIGLGGIFLLACGSASPPESIATVTPTPTVYLVRPTATPPPPIPTPSLVDTSEWKTYRTSSGVSIRYPPTWAVQESPGDPSGFVKLLNEHRQETVAQLPPQTEGGRSGDAWVDISPAGQARFKVDELSQLCQPSSPAAEPDIIRDAVEVTVAGRPAVWRVSQGPDVYNPRQFSVSQGFLVQLPSKQAFSVFAYAIDPDENTLLLLRTILSTLSFE